MREPILSTSLPIEMVEMGKARNAEVENWLREEVAAAYDEVKAHPEQTVSLDEAFAGFGKRIKSIAVKTKK